MHRIIRLFVNGMLGSKERPKHYGNNNLDYHFIHIPKNGGQSIRHALELLGTVSLKKPFHYRYIDVVNKIGRNVRYFCTVRNPWSRTASRYMFGKQNALIWPENDPRRLYICETSFEAYVKEQKILPIPEHPGMPWMGPLSSWFNQLEWIRDEGGHVACDCLRLENINEDISQYFGKKINIPRRNRTKDHYDYRQMYTDELIEIVAETFCDDIQYFGFSFEGPAKKNIAVIGGLNITT